MQDSNPFVNFRNGVGTSNSSRQSLVTDAAFISPTPLVLPPSPAQVLQCERRVHIGTQDGSGYDNGDWPTPRSPFAGPTNPWQHGHSTPSPAGNNPPKPVSTSEGYASLHAAGSGDDSGDDDKEAERDLQVRATMLNNSARQTRDYEQLTAQVLPNVQLVKSCDLSKLTKVGQGSFGEVWECSWMGSRVAAKYLLQHRPDPTMIREVEMLHNLTHPAVIRLLGICMDPPIILTQFCSRGSLYSCIRAARNNDPFKKKKLNWLCSLRMLEDVASGMMFLHSQNTLHGDLRTPNILLERDYTAKIADFGLAKVMQSTAGEPVSRTTNPRWLAPEVYKSNTLTKEGDVYSFGIIMLEMLTWTEPYADMNDAQVAVGLTCDPPIQPDVPIMSIPQRPYMFLDKYQALMRSCWSSPAQRPTFALLRVKLACMRRWTMLGQDVPRLGFVRQAVIMRKVINHWQTYKRDGHQPAFAFNLPPAAPTPHPPARAPRGVTSWSTASTSSFNTTEELILHPRPRETQWHLDPFTWRSRESSDSQPATPPRGFYSNTHGNHAVSPPSSPMAYLNYPDLEQALGLAPVKQTDSEERHETFMQLGQRLDTLLRQDYDDSDHMQPHTTGHSPPHFTHVSSNEHMHVPGGREDLPAGPVEPQGADAMIQPWNSAVINTSGQLPTVASSIPAAKPVVPAVQTSTEPHAGVPQAEVQLSQATPAAAVQQASVDVGSVFGGDDGGDIPWGAQYMSAGVRALAERVLMDMLYPRDQQQELIKQLVDCAMEDAGSTHENALMVMCQLADLDAGNGIVKRRMLQEGVLAACCNTLQRLRFSGPASVSSTSPLACCMALLQALWHVADPGRQETSLNILFNLLSPPAHLDLTLPQPLVASHKTYVLEAASIQLLLRLHLQHTPLPPNVRTLLEKHGTDSTLELLCSLPADGEKHLEDRAIALLSDWAHDRDLSAVIDREARAMLEAGSSSTPAIEPRLMKLLGVLHGGGAAGNLVGNSSLSSSAPSASPHWSPGPAAQSPSRPPLTSPYQTAQPPHLVTDPSWPWQAVSSGPALNNVQSMPPPSMPHPSNRYYTDPSQHHKGSISAGNLVYTPLQDVGAVHMCSSVPADANLARNSSNSSSLSEQNLPPGSHSSWVYLQTGSTASSSSAGSSTALPSTALSGNWNRNGMNVPSPGGSSVRPANHAVIDASCNSQQQPMRHGGLMPWSDPHHHQQPTSTSYSLNHQQPEGVHSFMCSQGSSPAPQSPTPPVPGWHMSLFNPTAPDASTSQPYFPEMSPAQLMYPSLDCQAAWHQHLNGYPMQFQPPFHGIPMANQNMQIWLEPSSFPPDPLFECWMPVSPSTCSQQYGRPPALAGVTQLPALQAPPAAATQSGPGRPPMLAEHPESCSFDPPLHASSAPNGACRPPTSSSHSPHVSAAVGAEMWRSAASSDTHGARDQDPAARGLLPPATRQHSGSNQTNDALGENPPSTEVAAAAGNQLASAEDVGFIKQHSHTSNEVAALPTNPSDPSDTAQSSGGSHHPRNGKQIKYVKPGGNSKLGTPGVEMKCKVPIFYKSRA